MPAAADTQDRKVRDSLRGHRAEARRAGDRVEDLAAKLLDLSKAMSNDWSAFARAVEDDGKEAAAAVR